MNLNKEEISEMNALMKSLENDISEMSAFNEKLKEIAEKKAKLEEFSDRKWMNYYDESEKYNDTHLEILNQDSLYNALVDADQQARELIKNAVNLI